mmetsp:Transcript_30977/g.84666  ORF Transcript_30977/g.84666 Transcript_30977/m.84666 type:complete len:206 (-) Transcript_30977:899-1516(-)
MMNTHVSARSVSDRKAFVLRKVDVLKRIKITDDHAPAQTHLQTPTKKPVLVVQSRLFETAPELDTICVQGLKVINTAQHILCVGELLHCCCGEKHYPTDDDVHCRWHLRHSKQLAGARHHLERHTPLTEPRTIERELSRIAGGDEGADQVRIDEHVVINNEVPIRIRKARIETLRHIFPNLLYSRNVDVRLYHKHLRELCDPSLL